MPDKGPVRDRTEDVDIEGLLTSAEDLLYQDIEREIGVLKGNPHGDIGDQGYDKYARAKVIFEKVIEVDPENMRALQGLAICEIMSGPLPLIQYMAPLDDLTITADDLQLAGPSPPPPWEEEGSSGHEERSARPPPPPPPPEMPWDIVASARQRDEEGIRYTSEAFGRARRIAEVRIAEMVAEAEARVKAGEHADHVMAVYSKELEEYQRELDRGWKGHGPMILDEAMEELRKAIRR